MTQKKTEKRNRKGKSRLDRLRDVTQLKRSGNLRDKNMKTSNKCIIYY